MKISLRLALISVILGLIWVTFIVTTSSTYLSSQKTLREHTYDIMQNVAKLAMQEAYTHLNHAQGAAILTRRLLSDDIVGSSGRTVEALEQYFYNNMAINPHFAGIYLGMPDGSFYDVRRHSGKVKNGFRTKIITHSDNGERRTHLIWRNENYKVVDEGMDPEDDYDPRIRPWYAKALQEKKIVWTDPYIFYSSSKPGITTAGPIFDKQGRFKGVIGVDIEIDQLSTFIASLKIGKSGSAFMLNGKGNVVAHPNLDKLRQQKSTDKNHYRLVTINELDDIASRKAFEALAASEIPKDLNGLHQPRMAEFEFNEITYTAMMVPFSRWDWPWKICVYLPENDYLGDLKANRQLNIFVTFAISLVATAIGLFIARGILQPISALEKEATSIKNGRFNSEPIIRSTYSEIRTTAETFQLMKNAVEGSQRRYQGIFDNIQDVYFEATMDGEILEISPSIEKVYGLKRELLIGKSMKNYFVDEEFFINLQKILVRHGHCDDFQVEFKSDGSNVAYGSINAELVLDAKGSPDKIIGSLRDITRRRATEEELDLYRQHLEGQVAHRTLDLERINQELSQEIEQRKAINDELQKREEEYHNLYKLNRMVTNNVHDLIWAKDLEGRYIFANQATCDKLLMCGTPEESYGNTDIFFADRERQQGYDHTFGEICENSDEITLRRKKPGRFLESGHVRETYLALDVYKAPMIDKHGDIIGTVGCGRDVTKEKAIEKELQLTEEKYRNFLDTNPDPIIAYDKEWRVVYFNHAFTEVFGWPLEECLGKKMELFVPDTALKETQQMIDIAESFSSYETHRYTKSGQILHVSMSVAINKDKSGNPIGSVVSIKDISEQKKLLVQLQRAQKMEALGILAGGVAHDINNVLSGVVSYPDLLLMQIPENSPLRKPLLTIQESGIKAADIVQDLLTLARRGVVVENVVNLNDIISEYLKNPEYEKLKSLHPDVNVETRFAADLFNITGSNVHLSKTVMNLVSNGLEAMLDGGNISISTENRYIDRPISGYDSIETGDYVTMIVADSGIGIAQDDKDRIFEPFYTKKVMGRSGTGLGMAVVWGTVKDHNGYIDVQSSEGRGTIFTLYFPATRRAKPKELIQLPIESYQGKGESILVVDDATEQREIASGILTALGYVVNVVSSGEEAVDYIKEQHVDLLLMDMIMDPGMDGMETYKRIIEIRPGQKAVIASGFSETERVKMAQILGAGAYIKKPYTMENLGVTIRNELDEQ